MWPNSFRCTSGRVRCASWTRCRATRWARCSRSSCCPRGESRVSAAQTLRWPGVLFPSVTVATGCSVYDDLPASQRQLPSMSVLVAKPGSHFLPIDPARNWIVARRWAKRRVLPEPVRKWQLWSRQHTRNCRHPDLRIVSRVRKQLLSEGWACAVVRRPACRRTGAHGRGHRDTGCCQLFQRLSAGNTACLRLTSWCGDAGCSRPP